MTVQNRSAKTKRPGLPSPARKPEKSIGWLGCLGILLLIVVFFVVGVAIFTFLFNIVSGIFNGPQIDWWQGLAIWLFLWVVGGVIRGTTSE